MSDAIETPSAGWRMRVAAFSLAFSIFAVFWFMVAALGTRFGFWPWQVGLRQMTFGVGFPLSLLSLAVGSVAVVTAIIKFPRLRAFIIAALGLLIAALCAFRLYAMLALGASLPPIHDIQTDWGKPIRFSEALMQAREADSASNDVVDAPIVSDWATDTWPEAVGRLVSELQEEAESGDDPVYPRIDTLYFDQSPAEIAAVAERLMKRRGWSIIEPRTEGDGLVQVEATATSGWFGFKDDIAVRAQSVDGVTRLDIRSVSRVGLSDLGANSKRVNGLLFEMQDRADGRWKP